MKIQSIAVHSGVFHADEVCAAATLLLLYPDLEIVRTRDEEKLQSVDARIDVGRKYDESTLDFDHHQESFTLTRENNIPYASAGLIWKHFGMLLVESKTAFDQIDKSLMQPIDANDNGLKIYESTLAEPYTLQDILRGFRPMWIDEDQDLDKGFFKAVNFFKTILQREIKFANSIEKGREKVRKAVEDSNGEYIVLEKPVPPWQEVVVTESEIKLVVSQSSDDTWGVKTVPKEKGSFDTRISLPQEWADKIGEELAQITGVADAIFCHKQRFMAKAESKEGAIKLAELALK